MRKRSRNWLVPVFSAQLSKTSHLHKQGFKGILEEAISARKRLADLYVKAFERDKDGFMAFVDKYGLYREYEYVQTPIILDRLLRDVLRSWL